MFGANMCGHTRIISTHYRLQQVKATARSYQALHGRSQLMTRGHRRCERVYENTRENNLHMYAHICYK